MSGWVRKDYGLGGGGVGDQHLPTTRTRQMHTSRRSMGREKAECGGELALGEIKRLIDGGIMSKGGGLCRGRSFPTSPATR